MITLKGAEVSAKIKEQMGIMAREYDRDYEFACTVITVTTVISMVTIPVFMYLMQTFVIFG